MLLIRHLRIIHGRCGYATHKKSWNKVKITMDKSKFSKNPGIQNQLKFFMQDNPDVDNIKAENVNPEELEADFMKASEIVDDYDRALAKEKEKHEFKAVERKYFKSSATPNMLKWAEKEQIRYLHNDNPDHWTLENLAKSFPATQNIIKKVLKSAWKPLNANDLIKHDERVAKNWNDFVQGHLKIDVPELEEHLQKFTSRQNNVPSFTETDLKKITENKIPKPKSSEFSSIISSYKGQTAKEEILLPATIDCIIENKKPKHVNGEKIHDKVQYSLESFKEKVKQEIDTSKVVLEENMLLLSDKKRNLVSNLYVAHSERYDSEATVTRQGKLAQISHFIDEQYPQRIFIPKNKRKWGALYKVKDCYYTSDGLFLYRVPGFTQEI